MKYSTDLVQHYTKIQKTIMQNAECNLSEAFAFLLLHYETGSCLVSKQSFNALATKFHKCCPVAMVLRPSEIFPLARFA